MHISPQQLRRLAHDRHAEDLARAHRARLLASRHDAAPERPGAVRPLVAGIPVTTGPRSRLAAALLRLAALLSPAHREALCAIHPSACPRQAS